MLSSPRRLVILFSVDSGGQATSPNVYEYRNTIINIAKRVMESFFADPLYLGSNPKKRRFGSKAIDMN